MEFNYDTDCGCSYHRYTHRRYLCLNGIRIDSYLWCNGYHQCGAGRAGYFRGLPQLLFAAKISYRSFRRVAHHNASDVPAWLVSREGIYSTDQTRSPNALDPGYFCNRPDY